MVLNNDTASELSPYYLADRTKASAVHEPASSFIKRLFADRLASELAAGRSKVVLFSAGGAGASKTTGIEQLLGDIKGTVGLIYDTTMNKLGSAAQTIDQALDAGWNDTIVNVYRDPAEDLVNGARPVQWGRKSVLAPAARCRSVSISTRMSVPARSLTSCRNTTRAIPGSR